VPLSSDAQGVVHVRGTRVTLDTVVSAFVEGATAEEIAHRYPSVSLSDVYAVISFYLARRSDVEAYLSRRRKERRALKRKNEATFDPSGIRDRLMERTENRT
jgi:uncharacterized protein (DUF433 family)